MTSTRRRGAALEEAILEAGWEQLVEQGYAGFTFEAVAERARTSKAVLYRRWPDKETLMLAVLGHSEVGKPTQIPNTGSLREDVIALLRAANAKIGDLMPALFSTILGAYFNETRTTLAELRATFLGSRAAAMEQIVQQAIDRGEIPPDGLAPRIVTLPFDLIRHELFMNLHPASEATIIDIVDTVFLPLVFATDESHNERQ